MTKHCFIALTLFLLLVPATAEARLPPLIWTDNWRALKAVDDLVESTTESEHLLRNLYGNQYYEDVLAQFTALKTEAHRLYYDEEIDTSSETWLEHIALANSRDELTTFVQDHEDVVGDFADRVDVLLKFNTALSGLVGNLGAAALSLTTEYSFERSLPGFTDLVFSGWSLAFPQMNILSDIAGYNLKINCFNGIYWYGKIPLEGCQKESYSSISGQDIYRLTLNNGVGFQFNTVKKVTVIESTTASTTWMHRLPHITTLRFMTHPENPYIRY